MKVNSKWKDRLFIQIFSDPKHILELYNAINETNYKDPENLDINTLEDVLYMHMKNDASFIIEDILNLWERQSTSNPNMPLRGLSYFAQLYQRYTAKYSINIYSSRLKKLPMPQYIVFYNGQPEEPERQVLRLSNAFIRNGGAANLEPCLEVKAVMLNINFGKNKELMERCKQLKDYAQLVSKIRSLKDEGLTIESAVDQAVQYCIDHDILAEFLLSHRSEAIGMFLTEYNEAAHMQMEREEWREEGAETGRIATLTSILRKKLCKGISAEDAASLLEVDLSAIRPIYDALTMHPDWSDEQVCDALIGRSGTVREN